MKTTQIILIIIILIAGAFYWYSYRPAHIRKECTEESEVWRMNTREERQKIYETCLHSRGL